MPSESELAYLAGLIDGEGSIRIEKSGGKYRYTPHNATVCVTNSNSLMITWICDKFGGHLYRKKGRTCWDVYWLGERAEEILREIYPYLTAKKEQAELVFAYRRLIGKPGKRLSPDNISKRWVIVEAMEILKKNNQIKIEGGK